MKRILSSLLLLLMSVGLWAADFPTFVAGSYAYETETTLYFTMDIDGQGIGNMGPLTYVSAFIDGECRGTANYQYVTDATGAPVVAFSLRVCGNTEDVGKTIELKALYRSVAYKLSTVSVTFNPSVPGQNLGTIQMSTLQGMNQPDPLEIAVPLPGGTFDVSKVVSPKYYNDDAVTSPVDESLNTIQYAYYCTANPYFSIDSETGILTAYQATPEGGSQQLVVSIRVVDTDGNQKFERSPGLQVIIKGSFVAVTSIESTYETTASNRATFFVGDNVFDLIKASLTLLPANASNKEVEISSASTDAVYFDAAGVAVKKGACTIEVRALGSEGGSLTRTFYVNILEPVVIVADPANYRLSQYKDVAMTLTVTGDNYDASLVAFEPVSYNDVNFTAASGSATNKTWNLRATAVGRVNYDITYDGKYQTTISCETFPEMKLAQGWDWVTPLYYDGGQSSISLKDATGYKSFLHQDADNQVVEIRSQHYLLYNDPLYGFYGNMTELNVGEGMYKFYTKYTDESFSALPVITNSKYWSTSYLDGATVHKGYSWIGYQFEQEADINQTSASANAQDGDMIISKDGFATWDAGSRKWISSVNPFNLKPGKGYIYYTEGEGGFEMNFAMEASAKGCVDAPAGNEVVEPQESVFKFDAGAFADNMAIVAMLDGMQNAEGVQIGAFVGDECRGRGVILRDGRALINAVGKFGEKVSFRLYNEFTGEYSEISETVAYGDKAGSLRAPVHLTASDVTAIGSVGADVRPAASNDVYDLQGRKVKNAQKGVYVINGKKIVK